MQKSATYVGYRCPRNKLALAKPFRYRQGHQRTKAVPFARVKHPGDNPPRALTPPAPPRPPPQPWRYIPSADPYPCCLMKTERAMWKCTASIHIQLTPQWNTSRETRPRPHMGIDHFLMRTTIAMKPSRSFLAGSKRPAASPRAGQARRTGAERTAGGPPPYTVPTQTSFRSQL